MEYVYTDGEYWHFMKTDGSYEQIAADKDAVSDAMQWLKEQGECTVTLWNDVPIQVVAPNFVDLEIVETDPVSRATQPIVDAGDADDWRSRKGPPVH